MGVAAGLAADSRGGFSGVSVVVLAAGFGTRMKSKTPKILHKICGKEMIFCILDELLGLSDDIHIVLYNEAKMVREAIEARYFERDLGLDSRGDSPQDSGQDFGESAAQDSAQDSVEDSRRDLSQDSRREILHFHLQNHAQFPGTAGALMEGESKLPFATKHERVLILSGDMPLVRGEILREFVGAECDIALGILELENAADYGRVVLENNRVKKIVEEKDADEKTRKINLANAGIYCLNHALLARYLPKIHAKNAQNEFYLTDLLGLAADEGCEIRGICAKEADFMGVNSRADLARAEGFMLRRLREGAMKNGVTMRLPESIYLEFGVAFEGECEVESGAVLKGATLIKNSTIFAHSVVESSVIEGSTIGPMARIRPNSHIKDSHIGDFVEVKAANLCGVKAGHLSYLGDCEIGAGTNIGAGVITCNYDGRAKHRTKIGENVFVGSDCQLIAPLEIAPNTMIAAGSTVNKPTKCGDLAISRAKQSNVAGFYWRFFAKNERD